MSNCNGHRPDHKLHRHTMERDGWNLEIFQEQFFPWKPIRYQDHVGIFYNIENTATRMNVNIDLVLGYDFL